MEFAQVVFYGRLGRQALAMLNLDPAQWRGARVLDCPGGPGSLSAELRAAGVDVAAVDPLDALAEAELRQRALADLEAALAALTSSQDIRSGRPAHQRHMLRAKGMQRHDLQARDQTGRPG